MNNAFHHLIDRGHRGKKKFKDVLHQKIKSNETENSSRKWN